MEMLGASDSLTLSAFTNDATVLLPPTQMAPAGNGSLWRCSSACDVRPVGARGVGAVAAAAVARSAQLSTLHCIQQLTVGFRLLLRCCWLPLLVDWLASLLNQLLHRWPDGSADPPTSLR